MVHTVGNAQVIFFICMDFPPQASVDWSMQTSHVEAIGRNKKGKCPIGD
jgi:hypothetical protein